MPSAKPLYSTQVKTLFTFVHDDCMSRPMRLHTTAHHERWTAADASALWSRLWSNEQTLPVVLRHVEQGSRGEIVAAEVRESGTRVRYLGAERDHAVVFGGALCRLLLMTAAGLHARNPASAMLEKQPNYNLLFRWFVGLNPDDAVWVPTVFSKNRDRLIEGQIADAFMAEVLRVADARQLLSHEHFTVDGTLLEAWASHKSVRPKDDPSPTPSTGGPKNPAVNFRGEKRSNATHQSVTDPEARIARKSNGTASILGHLGSVLMDNRHGLIVATDVRAPGYDAERDAAVPMVNAILAEAQAVPTSCEIDRPDASTRAFSASTSCALTSG